MNKEDLKKYEQSSKIGLTYEINGDTISVKNNTKNLVAEVSLKYSKEGVYTDVWFGFVTDPEYKEIMGGVYLDYFKESKNTKKLCNTLKLVGGMEDTTAAWFNQSLLPKLLEAGLQYNAMVIPEDVFANLSLTDNFNVEEYMKFFPSETEALSWLKSK
jgi:hypothetical protein